jgi:hypothetical protein
MSRGSSPVKKSYYKGKSALILHEENILPALGYGGSCSGSPEIFPNSGQEYLFFSWSTMSETVTLEMGVA